MSGMLGICRWRSGYLSRRYRNNDLALCQKTLAGQLIYRLDRIWRSSVLPRNNVQGIAGSHVVISPRNALIHWNSGDGLLKLLPRSCRETQVVDGIFRSGQAEQAGVEFGKPVEIGIDAFRNQPQVDRIIDSDRVSFQRKRRLDTVQSVLFRVLCHHGKGENDGYVVLRLLWQYVASVEFPEVGITSPLHRLLNVAWTRVIGSYGQIPVAKLVVQIFQVAGSSTRGFFGILTFVDPPASA